MPTLRGTLRMRADARSVKMQSGGVAVFSPPALTEEVKATVEQMGQVKYIAATAYPTAKVIGPEGLPEKRQQAKREDIKFDHLFKKEFDVQAVDPQFDAEFDHTFVHGHQNKELVFNHKPSKTLIEADLFFNLPAIESYSKSDESPFTGLATKMFVGLAGTTGSALNWQRRLLWYGISSGDRKSFNKSVATIGGLGL
ncbi:hypothetical protein MRB53_039734 [Persea americana]|nr:hypothetical protein MRB53_039734 [Persea americana]